MTINEYEIKYNREPGNNFAAACYHQRAKRELGESPQNPDQGDMNAWGISEDEWRDAIDAALTEMTKDGMACERDRPLV